MQSEVLYQFSWTVSNFWKLIFAQILKFVNISLDDDCYFSLTYNLPSQSMIKIRHITVFKRMNEITKTVFKKIEIDKLINNFSLPNY